MKKKTFQLDVHDMLVYMYCRMGTGRCLKTNGLFWLTTTPNVGCGSGAHPEIHAGAGRSLQPLDVQGRQEDAFLAGAARTALWFCEAMEGHFVGLHLHGAQFYGSFNEKRYDGYLAGGGLTYGYAWILSSHWNLEALIGVGYARLWYKESPHIPCNKCYERKTRDYVGPTKLALSISYIF